MMCDRRGCEEYAEYIVDYVLRVDNKITHQKKMCKDHKKATYMMFKIERIEVMNEEEKKLDIEKIMGKVCRGCSKPAVCDLIFGELVEEHCIPWCAHCMCPTHWEGAPFHHAESYNPIWKSDKKESQCTKCGELANVAALGDMYCTPCYNARVAVKKSTISEKIDGMIGDAIKETVDYLKEAFKPSPTPKVGEFTIKSCVDCGAQSTVSVFEDDYCTKCYAMRRDRMNAEPTGGTSIQEQYTKELYNRQPHYEGGIDPITFGQDNLSPNEMNGFYKMNVIKYVARCDRKNGLEDLQKARDYLNLLIASYQGEIDEVCIQRKDVLREVEERKRRIEQCEEDYLRKEVELCVKEFHTGAPVTIKRADVFHAVKSRIKGYCYIMNHGGDGVVFIEKQEDQ